MFRPVKLQSPPLRTQLLFRILLLVLHVLVNVAILAWLTDLDLSGSWLLFGAFVAAAVCLVFLFVRHLLSLLQYIKTVQP